MHHHHPVSTRENLASEVVICGPLSGFIEKSCYEEDWTLAIAVDSAPFIKQISNRFSTGKNHHRFCTQNKRVDWAVFFRPFPELKMDVSRGQQVEISKYGNRWRTMRRDVSRSANDNVTSLQVS